MWMTTLISWPNNGWWPQPENTALKRPTASSNILWLPLKYRWKCDIPYLNETGSKSFFKMKTLSMAWINQVLYMCTLLAIQSSNKLNEKINPHVLSWNTCYIYTLHFTLIIDMCILLTLSLSFKPISPRLQQSKIWQRITSFWWNKEEMKILGSKFYEFLMCWHKAWPSCG